MGTLLTLPETKREVIGIWLRKCNNKWYTVIAYTEPSDNIGWHNPEYAILMDDGTLSAPQFSDFGYYLIHGYRRYQTCRYALNPNFKSFYGSSR